MRAVVIDGAGSVRVNTQPDPALPGPDGVVVAVTAAASADPICISTKANIRSPSRWPSVTRR